MREPMINDPPNVSSRVRGAATVPFEPKRPSVPMFFGNSPWRSSQASCSGLVVTITLLTANSTNQSSPAGSRKRGGFFFGMTFIWPMPLFCMENTFFWKRANKLGLSDILGGERCGRKLHPRYWGYWSEVLIRKRSHMARLMQSHPPFLKQSEERLFITHKQQTVLTPGHFHEKAHLRPLHFTSKHIKGRLESEA